jgi:hypothetical protein
MEYSDAGVRSFLLFFAFIEQPNIILTNYGDRYED